VCQLPVQRGALTFEISTAIQPTLTLTGVY
jgi:hypothetical protein